jgi:hypothetical protein
MTGIKHPADQGVAMKSHLRFIRVQEQSNSDR